MSYRPDAFDQEALFKYFNPPSRPAHLRTGLDPAIDYADDGKEIAATYLGMRQRESNSYLLYAYRFRNSEYGFLWETSFDEGERAKSGGDPHIWYDDIREGDTFLVRVRLKDPKQHVIMDEPFTGMNDSPVFFLGETIKPPADRSIKDGDQ